MIAARFNKEVPFFIREQLKEIGFSTSIVPYKQIVTYAYVFDYLFEKGYLISVSKDYDLANECFSGAYDWSVDGSSTKDSDAGGFADTWFEAANKAIESCIDLINKKSVNNE